MSDEPVEVLWGTGRVRLRRGESSFEMTYREVLDALPRIQEAAERARRSMEEFVDFLAPAPNDRGGV